MTTRNVSICCYALSVFSPLPFKSSEKNSFRTKKRRKLELFFVTWNFASSLKIENCRAWNSSSRSLVRQIALTSWIFQQQAKFLEVNVIITFYVFTMKIECARWDKRHIHLPHPPPSPTVVYLSFDSASHQQHALPENLISYSREKLSFLSKSKFRKPEKCPSKKILFN